MTFVIVLAVIYTLVGDRTVWGEWVSVLAGDFNVPAETASLSPLRAFLSDSWRVAGSGWGATVPEFLPLARVDQIWVSPEIQPVSVRVVRVEGSDHRAVVADVKFRETSF